MDAQSDLGQSEDATISQIQPPIDVDSVHSPTAAAHGLMQCWCGPALQGVFIMASTWIGSKGLPHMPHCTEVILFGRFWCFLSQLTFILVDFFFQSIFIKVAGSLSGLCGPPVILSLSLTKRASLYHDSSFFVLDSLPPGNPWPNRCLCGLPVWLTEWCTFMNHLVRFPNWRAAFCHPDISVHAYKCHAVESLPPSKNWNSCCCFFFACFFLGAKSRIFKVQCKCLSPVPYVLELRLDKNNSLWYGINHS